VTAVVFDVGETLVDETRMWEAYADAAGVQRFTLMALIGAMIARGESHERVWDLLELERPPGIGFFTDDVFYPDALPCIRRLREHGYVVGAAGNMRRENEGVVRDHVDVAGSSARWGAEKPAAAFFERIAESVSRPADEIAYVGDRVDNDVLPSLAGGMVAVHIRRGPWGYLHEPPPAAIRIDSLDELPEALR
jgi:FMN phosphatase YigB (HAD superfamily)